MIHRLSILMYFRGSLEFSIIGNKLLLQGGVAYDQHGRILNLAKQSYIVLEEIDLTLYENHKEYYFYLALEEDFRRIPTNEIHIDKNLENDIHFFISSQVYNNSIILGKVSIDYKRANEENIQTIQVPNNMFCPEKNEINVKDINRLYRLPPPIEGGQYLYMSNIILNFSKSIFYWIKHTQAFSFLMIAQTFFQFSNQLIVDKLTIEATYYRLLQYIELFTWIDKEALPQNVRKLFKECIVLALEEKRNYKASFYNIDFDNQKEILPALLNILQEITMQLREYEKEECTVENLPSLNFEQTVSDNITYIEDNDSKEESTILLSKEKENCIQVGRGSQSGNDIVIGEGDKTVSRVHLKIMPYKQGFFIEDVSSMGTYVDGVRIEKNVKKFVTSKNQIILGKKNCILDFNDYRIQALLQE